jgi:HK97 family phage prohead protease
MEKGCYRKTVLERGPAGSNEIVILWGHRDPFGMPTKMFEDETGLWVVGEASDTQENKDRLVYMRDGVVKSLSVGFTIPKGKAWYEEDTWTRHIQEVKLYEFSPVMFPANEAARIAQVAKYHDMALTVKAMGKDQILERANELEDIDERDLDAALSILSDFKTLLYGSEEDRRALKAHSRKPQVKSTPETPETPVVEDDPQVLTKQEEDALQSALDGILLSKELSGLSIK